MAIKTKPAEHIERYCARNLENKTDAAVPIDELSEAAKQSDYESLGVIGPYRCVRGYPANREVKNLGDLSSDYNYLEEFAVPSVFLNIQQIAAKMHRGFVIDASSKYPRKELLQGMQDFYFELFGNPQIIPLENSLGLAISEYKDLWPPFENPRDFMRCCHSMSLDFMRIACKKYGIEGMEEKCYTFIDESGHCIIVYNGEVIDWTIRQFSGYERAPYPFIYSFPKRKNFNGLPNREEIIRALRGEK